MIFLPGYLLHQLIYASSRTKVYRGTRVADSAAVIVKIPRKLAPSVLDIQKLHNHLAIARALDLPALVKPLSVEQCGSRWILVMPDEGLISLAQYLEQSGYFTQIDANFWAIARQLIGFLDQLHAESVVAQNLNLHNILIEPKSKTIKIADLSAAKLISAVAIANQTDLLPESISPTTIHNNFADDLYSLGIVFYQLLTGQKPSSKIVSPINLNVHIDSALNNLIVKLLAHPQEQTAQKLKLDLEQIINSTKKLELPSFIIDQKIDETKAILKTVYRQVHPTAITTWEGKLIEVNKAFLNAFGVETEDLFDYTIADLQIWLKSHQEQIKLKQPVGEGVFDRVYADSVDSKEGNILNPTIQLRVKSGQLHTFLINTKSVEIEKKTCIIITLKSAASSTPSSEKLKLLQTGIAAANSELFNCSLACLTQLLDVGIAIITEIIPGQTPERLRILAVEPNQSILSQFINLNGSPWQQLSVRASVKYSNCLPHLFPDCQLLSQLEAQSFLGVAILNSQHQVIGHLAVLDTQAIDYFSADDELILTMFAARLGAEIERQQLETQLQQQNQFWHDILHTLPDLIALCDRADRIIFANQALADYYDTTVEQICFKTLQQLQPQLEPGQILKAVYGSRHYPNRSWYKVKQKLLPGSDSLKLIIATDITESQVITASLVPQLSQAQLLEKITGQIRSTLDTKQIFRTAAGQIATAFDVSRCLIFAYNLSGKVQVSEYVSQPHLAIGEQWHPESLTIDRILRDDRAVAIDQVNPNPTAHTNLHQQFEVKSLMAVRTTAEGQSNGLIVLHQCDRYRVWQPWEVELFEAIAVQLGITLAQAKLLETEKQQRQKLEQSNQILEEAKQAAQAANRLKGEFLANISHELRTPLHAIIGFSQLMLKEAQSTQLEYLSAINRSGEHLLGLINNVLEMSKIEAGKVAANPTSFNLNHLLIDVGQMLALKAEAKALALTINTAPEVPSCIRTDESKLRQILINLFDNAIKFTETGSVSLQVDLVESTQAQICFTLTDTGVGIAPNEINNLFQPFSQTQAGRQAQGTGLGLAISRNFIQLLGGQISVESQPNFGTTFRFSIPIELGQARQTNSTTQQVISLAPNQPDYKILVVEDYEDNRQLLVELLNSVGFQVQAATDGREALQLWQIWQPQLIWMDMRMPIMDGMEATRRIKAQAVAQSISPPVIIAITASAFEDQRRASLVAGCDDFVTKPLHFPTIFCKIKRHLGVNYTYAQTAKFNQENFNQKDIILGSVSLKNISSQWCQDLRESAIALDETRILRLVAAIKAVDPTVAHRIESLVKTCRFDLILQLLDDNERVQFS